MRTLGSHTGYLVIDHSNSPGVSEEFVRASGRDVPFAAEGQVFEADTFTCPHCQGIVLKNPLREKPRNICRKCMKVTCDNPSCNLECVPIAKVFDIALTEAHRNPHNVEDAIRALRQDILG